jgi:hypothetical protein
MQRINDPNTESGAAADSHMKHSEARDVRDDAKQKAHQAYDDLRQGTRKIARDSGSYLKKVVADQQILLVEKLEEYRDAAKVASDKLESDDDTVASRNIRKAADGLESIANYVRQSEPNDFLSDASRMARKRPELVFGGLFLTGLGMARIMKASARERRQEEFSSYGGGESPWVGDSSIAADSTPYHQPTAPPEIPAAGYGDETPTPAYHE